MRSPSLILLFCITVFQVCSQDKTPDKIDAKDFFLDERPMEAHLSIDLGALLGKGMKRDYMKAVFSCKLPDSTSVSEEIRVHTRGHFRHDYCFMPPLKLNFHNPTSPILYKLSSLKLTSACKISSYYDQLVLREFLVYKMYNLISDKSLRVRMVKITFDDEKHKKKSFSAFAFFVEDPGAMAKRNHCEEVPDLRINTEQTDRQQMTLLAVFEFMIGNTDWAVPVDHNIKLIRSKEDSLRKPFAVGYDFDYSGIVNAEYAIPDARLGTETVLERVYRGFPRTMTELEITLKIFEDQKDKLYSLIKGCEGLNNKNKDEMAKYLDQFYKIISDKRSIKSAFIDNARTN